MRSSHKKALRWIGIFLLYKTFILALGFVGLTVFARIWPYSYSHFTTLLFQWDAKHLLKVASQGYLGPEPTIQIFPVPVLLINLIHLVVPHWQTATLLVTQICSFFAFYYFYRLARLELNEEQSNVALLLFALFPTAYFLTAPYTEALFCATTFAAVYYAQKNNYKGSAIAGYLASASRITGLMLAPAFAVYLVLNWKKLSAQQRKGLFISAFAIGCGYLTYLAVNKYYFGDWFFYMGQQAKHWGLHMSWPFRGAVEAMKAWPMRTPDQKMSIIILELGFTFVAVGLLPWIWRKRNALDFSYMLLTLLLVLSLDFWLSRPRYVLPLYPMFIVTAPWFAKSSIRLGFYLLASLGLFGIYWTAYLNAHWAF